MSLANKLNFFMCSILSLLSTALVADIDSNACNQPINEFTLESEFQTFNPSNALSLVWLGIHTLDSTVKADNLGNIVKLEDSELEGKDKDSDADLLSFLEQNQFKNSVMREFERFNIRYVITEHEGRSILVFRHTLGLKNWLSNFDYGLASFDIEPALGEKIHHGFGHILSHIWPQLLSDVVNHTEKTGSLWIYGNSLGGALGLLTTPSLVKNGVPIEQLYLTGTPKAASQKWVEKAQELVENVSIYRMLGEEDIIARLPVHRNNLHEFGQAFRFPIQALNNAIGGLREKMKFDTLGQEVHLSPNQNYLLSSVEGTEEREANYWLNLAERFKSVDLSFEGNREKLKQRWKIIETNLLNHQVRQPESGYACLLFKAVKE